MEGNQVGIVNTPTGDELNLLWPRRLMDELATSRRRHNWATPLAITNYILASLLALAVGPIQLILLVLTQDYVMVTEVYYPNIMKIALLVSGLVAISTAVTAYRAWREQPKRSLMVSVLGISTTIVILIIWIAGFLVNFKPNSLAFILTLVAVAGWVLAIVVAKQFFSAEKKITLCLVYYSAHFFLALPKQFLPEFISLAKPTLRKKNNLQSKLLARLKPLLSSRAWLRDFPT